MKIIIGSRYFADQPRLLSLAAKKAGIDTLFVTQPSSQNKFGYSEGLVLPETLSGRLRWLEDQISDGLDAVINFQTGLLDHRLNGILNTNEYEFLLKNRVKVFHRFTGFDLRLAEFDKVINPYSPFHHGQNWPFRASKNRHKKFLEKIFHNEKITKVVQDPELLAFCPDAILIPRIINLKQRGKIKDPSKVALKDSPVLIVHAPSNPSAKGTQIIEDALSKLENHSELSFKYKRLISRSNANTLEEFKKADIIIDQILIGAPGVVTLEGWSLGKSVVCYFNKNVEQFYGEQQPVFNANPDNITQVLYEAIASENLRKKVSASGLKACNQHHTIDAVAKQLDTLKMHIIDFKVSSAVSNKIDIKLISREPLRRYNLFTINIFLMLKQMAKFCIYYVFKK